MQSLYNTDVVILCGGLGTRVKSVLPNKPKVLAPINNIPFLDYLINHLTKVGFKRFILCLGHLHNLVIEHCNSFRRENFVFSVENYPLGTAGAIKNAEKHIRSDNFVVLNGDSFCDTDYVGLLEQHEAIDSDAVMVISKDLHRTDVGNVKYNEKSKIITSFNEKECKYSVWVNSGIYLLSKKIISTLPNNTFLSLEHDLFPDLAKENKLYSFFGGPVYDIGTTERYNDIINNPHLLNDFIKLQ